MGNRIVKSPSATGVILVGIGVGIGIALAGCSSVPDHSAVASTSPHPSPAFSRPPADSKVAPKIEPIIVVAGVDIDGKNVTVSGYVAGILESGGECRYLFASGANSFAVTSTGNSDRSSTSCGSPQAPIGDFTKGSWGVTMRYTTLSGDVYTSKSARVEIP